MRGFDVGVAEQVGEQVLGELGGDRHAGQAGEGRHPDQRAFELTDVRGDAGGDELQGLLGHLHILALGLVAQDRQAGLDVGWLDVGDQPPPEAPDQPFLQRRDGVGDAVARDHDLLVGAVEGVERVEELLLEAFSLLEELDVVDQQDVDVAVATLEGGVGLVADGVDELVEEVLGRHVAHVVVLVVVVDVVPDGVQQVGLAESRPSRR